MTLGDFEFPASDDRVPLVGTRLKHKGRNAIWFGDDGGPELFVPGHTVKIVTPYEQKLKAYGRSCFRAGFCLGIALASVLVSALYYL